MDLRAMRTLLRCLPLAVLAAVAPAAHAQTWNLVWSDEFNGTSVDTSNWNFEVGGHGWGNNELEYYTNGNNCVDPERRARDRGAQGERRREELHVLPDDDEGQARVHLRQDPGADRDARRPGAVARLLDAGDEHRDGRLARLRRDRHHGACQHRARDPRHDPLGCRRLCVLRRKRERFERGGAITSTRSNGRPLPSSGSSTGRYTTRRTSRTASTARRSSTGRSSSC